ncbi:hypothetical protein H0H81_009716 [Sphagnurus paluster]|uniref:DNA polymerase n=1 Tax=Sphagnurus paluster TaxID=117069 RepID=A0A9P7GIB4_9AGAR|nr:hypothetical protein H0H81_009716 [Sphagnurus paluster]
MKSLNHAIALSLKRNPLSSGSQYIRAIILVKGVPFYGFHSTYTPFLKVFLADPAYVHRTVTILQSASVMGTHFRVFESHLSYTLQFMCDFGLYGCGWIDLEDVFQRDSHSAYEGEYAVNERLFDPSPYFRQTHMPLEVDAIAPQIMNRHNISARSQHHRIQIPPPFRSDPVVSSVRELWEDERKRRAARGLDPSPEIPVDPSDSCRGLGGDWVAEAQWWDQLREKIHVEREGLPQESPGGWENWVMTTFESIEALWEQPWRVWRPAIPRQQEQHVPTSNQTFPETYRVVDESQWNVSDKVSELDDVIDVDISMLSSQEVSDLIEFEEGELARREHDNIGVEEDADLGIGEDHEEDLFDDDEDIVEEPGLDRFLDPFEPTGDIPIQADFELKLCSSSSQGQGITDTGPVDFTRMKKLLRESYAVNTIKAVNTNRYEYSSIPPSASDLLDSMGDYGILRRVYQPPYYTLICDVPVRSREYGGLLFHLKGGQGITNLENWDVSDTPRAGAQSRKLLPSIANGIGGWEYASSPPGVKEIKRWLSKEAPVSRVKIKSQIEGPTPANLYGLKETPRGPHNDADTSRDGTTMSILSLEIFAPTNDGKAPNPEINGITAAFYAYQTCETQPRKGRIIVVQASNFVEPRIRDLKLEMVENEIDLINKIVDVVRDLDPDVLTGWDTQKGSWGYLDTRGRSYGFQMSDLVSRAPPARSGGYDQWGIRHTSTFKAAGRHVLNLWRIMRSEHALTSYSLENVAFNVLGRRIPRYSDATLSYWHYNGVPHESACMLRYFLDRTNLLLEIIEGSDVITKTAEFARVFGVDFFSVISRGSQFKVESFMFRIAKPENFVLISPSKRDVANQNAAECIPLIMEPASGFYSSPLVVLDFQSLYPSIMIAYNYCYSTCLGRVKDFCGRNKLGVVDLDLPPGLLRSLSEHIQSMYNVPIPTSLTYFFKVAPNGIIYVKPEVRKGLLGRMLVELIGTRVMVKQAMKGAKNDKSLQRILNARQLSLKYIANVTYGYTSANYSGRMPAVEIADSIVQSGRETLEKVVYGDTDSIFIYLLGRTKEQAFLIGNDIADTITAMNPSPIKLKFEKVYLPCVLMAKKRYVGFKYEHIDQEEPIFDAKGIETVRRDGVGAQRKMTETCLNENAPPPPGAVVAARRMVDDPTSEPQYGERVPYVIVRGTPGKRLVDRAMDPMDMLRDRYTTPKPIDKNSFPPSAESSLMHFITFRESSSPL